MHNFHPIIAQQGTPGGAFLGVYYTAEIWSRSAFGLPEPPKALNNLQGSAPCCVFLRQMENTFSLQTNPH